MVAVGEISRCSGRDGRRSGADKVDDGGDEARGRDARNPDPKPWMREVDLL